MRWLNGLLPGCQAMTGPDNRALSPRPCLRLIRVPASFSCGVCMRRMELEPVILRWKKTTRALKADEQEYGRRLTDVLERVTDAQLVHFRDPVEAAAFFCMVALLRKMDETGAGTGMAGPVGEELCPEQSVICGGTW